MAEGAADFGCLKRLMESTRPVTPLASLGFGQTAPVDRRNKLRYNTAAPQPSLDRRATLNGAIQADYENPHVILPLRTQTLIGLANRLEYTSFKCRGRFVPLSRFSETLRPVTGTLRKRPLYFANSLLVFAALTGIIAHEHGPYTASLLLLALATLYPLAKDFPEAFKLHWPWILGLVAYGGSSIALGLSHGTPIDELGKPLRFILGVLVFLHLARTGFSAAAFWWGVGLGAAVAGALAIHEVAIEGARRATLGFNPVPFGILLSTLGTLALYRASTHPRLPGVMVFFMFSGLAFAGTIASGTRGAWLIWIVGTTLIALFRLRRSAMLTSQKWLLLATVLLGVAGLTWSAGHDRIDRSLEEIRLIQSGELQSSLGTRIQQWHIGAELGMRNPLTGLGADRTEIHNAAKETLGTHGYEPRVITEFTHFHNQYIENFVTFGLPGLIAWLALLAALVFKTSPSAREPAIVLLSAFAIGSLFESTMEAGRLIFMIILVGSMVRLLHDPIREEEATRTHDQLRPKA